jgi:uncharacterized protein
MTESVPLASPYEFQSSSDRKLIAPLWHTILFAFIILGISALSYFATRRLVSSGSPSQNAHVLTYLATFGEEWVLFLYVYLGMRARRVTVRQCINARWTRGRDVGRDILIALLVWAGFVGISSLSSVIFRGASAGGAKVVQQLTPRTALELLLWIALSISAGFCEEFIFRGYLQEQCRRLTGSVYLAVLLQALLFGCGHGYQGWALMLTIVFIGLLFGVAAAWRKSLVPTMFTHGAADSVGGIGSYLAHVLHRV